MCGSLIYAITMHIHALNRSKMLPPYMIASWIVILSIICFISSIIDLFMEITETNCVKKNTNIDNIAQDENEYSLLSSLEDDYDFDDDVLFKDEL